MRLQETGHVLYTEDMDTLGHKLVHKVEVVLQGVLCLLWVRNIARVANDGLANTAGLLRSIDTKPQVLCSIQSNISISSSRQPERRTHVVQGVENTEDVETIFHRLLGEIVDGVVPVLGSVSFSRAIDLHTGSWYIRLRLHHVQAPGAECWVRACGVYAMRNISELYLRANMEATHQTFPGVLVQEPHCDIKRSTTPALETVRIRERITRLLRNVCHVNGTQTRSKKRLVRVAPSGIHDEAAGVLADGLGEGFRTFLDYDGAPSLLTRLRRVQRGPIGISAVLEGWDNNFVFEARFTLCKRDLAC